MIKIIKNHIGERYFHPEYGWYEIIGFIRGEKNTAVRIKFDNTGYEYNLQYYQAKALKVIDRAKWFNDIKNNIFNSKYGPYQIIHDYGYNNKSHYVRIKFLDTGYEYDVGRSQALNGYVKDPTRFLYDRKDIEYISRYYGPFKIIENLGHVNRYRRVIIQFLLTGSIVEARYDDIKKGEVSDPAYKSYFEAREKIGPTPILDVDDYLYTNWIDMRTRCYNKEHHSYRSYGAKGVSMSLDWLNDFNIFKYDVQQLPGWINKYNDPLMFHLDKDFLQHNLPINQRVYSKNTCIWLSTSLNYAIKNHPQALSVNYNCIYGYHNIFFIKFPNPDYYPIGPFYDYEYTFRLAHECYNIIQFNDYPFME